MRQWGQRRRRHQQQQQEKQCHDMMQAREEREMDSRVCMQGCLCALFLGGFLLALESRRIFFRLLFFSCCVCVVRAHSLLEDGGSFCSLHSRSTVTHTHTHTHTHTQADRHAVREQSVREREGRSSWGERETEGACEGNAMDSDSARQCEGGSSAQCECV